MTTQKKKDLKDQYQIADLLEYDRDAYVCDCISIKEGGNRGTVE